ncbi:hypothetical protein FQA47_004019 [Oryzias melastigma]|uniref:Uncharacterized protein n=1 Tax=Oryzias melastigma TaxID=30732 RepID=A0A834BSH4_ORYME|nr:hypothetical protein FQA47_004019 [Oryzias melastigma]
MQPEAPTLYGNARNYLTRSSAQSDNDPDRYAVGRVGGKGLTRDGEQVQQVTLRMIYFTVFALFAAFAAAEVQPQHYSYSPSVGSASGSEYSLTGTQRITAVRVWENYGGSIRG